MLNLKTPTPLELKVNANFLKLAAIISMTIDHFNSIVLDNKYLILQCLGRLAFPLFTFLIIYNYFFHTRNQKRYLNRLIIFAIISQPFYSFTLLNPLLNIFITLTAGLLIVHLTKKSSPYYWLIIIPTIILHLLTYDTIGAIIPFGLAGILLMYVWSIFINQRKNIYLAIIIVVFFLLNFVGVNIQTVILGLSTLLSLPLIYLSGEIKPRFNKLFSQRIIFYFYYPCHFLLLLALKTLIN